MNVRSIIRLLEANGWKQFRMKGSHGQFKHPTRPGVVTIPGKPGAELAIGTLNSIYKQAGLKK